MSPEAPPSYTENTTDPVPAETSSSEMRVVPPSAATNE